MSFSELVQNFLEHFTAKPTAESVSCSAFGAPPMPTVEPVTFRPHAKGGRVLSFDQNGVTRYACLNFPVEAQDPNTDRKWPLVIYLHGSRTTPDSIYRSGKQLFELHETFALSDDPATRGFILLSPEGRRAKPWQSLTGTGFHWDEWYRNPDLNLDALAIDHFFDEVVKTGKVDSSRVYIFGWSNGAYMTVLYGGWRGARFAAMGQYAGGDPWSRTPCPTAPSYTRQVPLILLRNLCDYFVTCSETSQWIQTLQQMNWPFEYHSLDVRGRITDADRPCDQRCSKIKGLYDHIRWPDRTALEVMLSFFKAHKLPQPA